MEPKFNLPAQAGGPQKKHLLFVITQSEIGGAQQFLIQLIGHLNPDSFTCTIVVGADGKDQIQKFLPSNITYIVAEHLRRDPSPWTDILSIFELRMIFKRQKPNVIFLNSSKAGFNGSLASVILGQLSSKIIYRIGGWSFRDPRPWWQRKVFLWLEKISASWKDYIIVNNTSDLEQARENRIFPRQELLLIHNGIDPYMKFMDWAEARAKIQSKIHSEAKILVGTIANFYPAKGLSTLLDTAVDAPTDVNFVIIGDGQLRSQLEQKIKEKGLERKVFLLGHLPNASQYLSAFNIFVLPSLKEGFPWTVLEAMAAKVPVIGTKVGALPEIIQSGLNGILVTPGNSAALLSAINELIADEKLRGEMAIQAHQTLLKKFDLRSMITRYEELFNSF